MSEAMYRGVAFPWHCDSMGHVATRFYTQWFDEASYHFMASMGGSQKDLEPKGLGWADVKSTIEYRHELCSGDLFIVESRFQRLGSKSLASLHELKLLDGTLIASQEVTTVQFDLKARKAVPVEENIREKISKALDAVEA